jgi:hypothetical protein
MGIFKTKAEAERNRGECGPCTACCTTHGIAELGKPTHADCPKLIQLGTPLGGRDSGCTIYADRPPSCAAFECLWLAGVVGGAEAPGYRPDLLGVVFGYLLPHQTFLGRLVISALEYRAGAVDEERVKYLLGRIGREYLVYVFRKTGEKYLHGPRALVAEVIDKVRARKGEDSVSVVSGFM